MLPLSERLRLALDRRPDLSVAEFARQIGVKPPSVFQWLNGRSRTMRADSSRKAAAVLGCRREWLETGRGDPWLPQSTTQTDVLITPEVAHELSPGYLTVAPTITWEFLMKSAPNDLPSEFYVVLVDDAMAPLAPAGTKVKLATGAPYTPGDAVLACDKTGALYLREYRALLGGDWSAHATNSAYPSLSASAHGLIVLAVLVGIETRWAALSR